MKDNTEATEPLSGEVLPEDLTRRFRREAVAARRGRPRLYNSPEELEDKILDYFEYCMDNNEPLTITGVCLWCGFGSVKSFYDYGNRPEFVQSIQLARTLISHGYEKLLSSSSANGARFALNCINKGEFWQERKELTVNNATAEDRLEHLR